MYETNCFLEIFPNTENVFSGPKTQQRTNTKISKVKDLTLILLITIFSLSSLHLLSKNRLKQSFCYTFFTHSQPFNEMFIFSSKSSCYSGTFTNVLFTSLLTKNI